MMKKDWMIKESELDDDQIKVLMATLEKSCIVSGCAGSGKSVLALIKALRVQKEFGDNYKVIVFTKALCNYMNVGRRELGLHNDFYYYWYWKNKLNCSSADYIIVDEIQDFNKEEITEFITAAKKNFFFFGDTAQSLYEGLKETIPVDDIRRDLVPKNKMVKNFELYRNYRLPIPVAKVALQVGMDVDPFDATTYKSKETKKPRFVKYDNRYEQLKAVHRIIQNDGGVADVAILLPHNDDVKQVYGELTKMGGNYDIRYNDKEDWKNSIDRLDFNSTNPKIMTYHSAKGLQFETVILPYIEDFSDENISDRKALYVAMTRTYRKLYVLYSGYLPSPLSSIDESLYETTETENLEDF